MVLGKITIDNSVRYIPKTEQTKEGDSKPKTIKSGSFPRNQNKNISQNSKKFLKKYFSSRIQISKMNIELLLLIKKHTDILIQQTKTKPQETLEFKSNKQMQTFSINPPINLVEEGKWLFAVSSFGCTNSVCNITHENNSFSIIIRGHYQIESAEKTIVNLNKLLELRSLELQVKEVRKRGNKIKILFEEYKLSDFDTKKIEIIEELRTVKYNDLEDLVYRMQLTYDEIIDDLNLKYIPTKRTGYSLNPCI